METKNQSGPKINKEEKTGLAGILSALGWNAATGEGVSGGLGGLIDAATSGGILATKAGIVGMVLVGSTIAGGVGWLGYKTLGPGSSGKNAQVQVFQPRPPQTAGSTGAQGNGNSSGAGNSSSLSGLSQANQGAMGQNSSQNQTASVAAAAAPNTAPPPPSAGKTFGGAAGAMPKISGSKIGQLSNLNAAGGAAPAAKTAAPSHLLAAAAPSGAMGASPRAATAGRGFGSSGPGGGSGANMMSRGSGYGGVPGPGAVPGNGLFDGTHPSSLGMPSGAGAGGIGSGAPSAFPNAASYGGQYSPSGAAVPQSSNGTDVTPWQGAINMAAMLSMLAAALLYLGYKLSKGVISPPNRILLMVIGGLVAMLGGFIAMLGSKIAGGQYGQNFQGGMFILSGAMTSMAGIALAAGGAMTNTGISDGFGGGSSTLMMTLFMASGAAGLGSAMLGYLTPGQSYPAAMWYGNPPDWTNPNAQVNPNPGPYMNTSFGTPIP